MGSLREWPAPGKSIKNSDQFDASLGFVNPQRLGSKTPAYPEIVLLSLLEMRLAKKQSVYQMYPSSVFEAEAANPLPVDLATETGFAAKRRGAAFFDTAFTLLVRRLKATVTRLVRSSFMLKGELYNPKNPVYAVIRDMESTKGDRLHADEAARSEHSGLVRGDARRVLPATSRGDKEEADPVRLHSARGARVALIARRLLPGGLQRGAHDRGRASSRRRVNTARRQDPGAAEVSRTASRGAQL